ncbi:hypothetical protein GCT19_35675 [Paraburkholderia sp. CNPSo 3155]|uniref:hypothetical protein n=1 Tax=Paraburkholderia atlantica TaxID=2654982 RepID=UPI00128D2D88|nr:hypothetical protein [Paraburkholderia atlantica]MPW10869.1 hypothetical protein [Paraburkholderia atlantica]
MTSDLLIVLLAVLPVSGSRRKMANLSESNSQLLKDIRTLKDGLAAAPAEPDKGSGFAQETRRQNRRHVNAAHPLPRTRGPSRADAHIDRLLRLSLPSWDGKPCGDGTGRICQLDGFAMEVAVQPHISRMLHRDGTIVA